MKLKTKNMIKHVKKTELFNIGKHYYSDFFEDVRLENCYFKKCSVIANFRRYKTSCELYFTSKCDYYCLELKFYNNEPSGYFLRLYRWNEVSDCWKLCTDNVFQFVQIA